MKRIGDMMTPPRATDAARNQKRIIADEKTVFFLAERAIGALYGVRGRQYIAPRHFRDGKLFLSCGSPLWANELWVTREAFRDHINHELGHEAVSDIRTSE